MRSRRRFAGWRSTRRLRRPAASSTSMAPAMFAKAVIAPALLLAAQISIPFGKPPPRVAAPIAPIETAGPLWADACRDSDDWEKPAPPVRIHANTYLVGTCGISSILIVGDKGDILIDGGPEAAADLIANNIRELGFSPRDVRIILNGHEHFDHAGGIARLQQLTGAQVYASAAAANVLRTGSPSADDPQAGVPKPLPPGRGEPNVHGGGEGRVGGPFAFPLPPPGDHPGGKPRAPGG